MSTWIRTPSGISALIDTVPDKKPVDYAATEVIGTARAHPDGVHVDLWYPRNEGATQAIVVGLCDVRAADSVRVSYDFERDGWVIQQAKKSSWEPGDTVCDPQWTEVAFIQAWALHDEEEDQLS